MPILPHTIIVPNHPSVNDNMDAVMEYLNTELQENRMSGPFSQQQMERICRGYFYASPLIVASQDEGPGLPPKRRVCRNLSKGDRTSMMASVNSFIEKEDFPTRFDMASKVADKVSFRVLYCIIYPSSICACTPSYHLPIVFIIPICPSYSSYPSAHLDNDS
jgi:hypothetical protein